MRARPRWTFSGKAFPKTIPFAKPSVGSTPRVDPRRVSASCKELDLTPYGRVRSPQRFAASTAARASRVA